MLQSLGCLWASVYQEIAFQKIQLLIYSIEMSFSVHRYPQSEPSRALDKFLSLRLWIIQ